MNDKGIIELFFARDEQAIAETEKEYGALCRYIASNVLAVKEDVEECVSDVMLALECDPARPSARSASLYRQGGAQPIA